jgi:hypothetical protein
MSAALVDGFSGQRALVASAIDAWAIRGPGLLLKQGLIERSGSSRGGSSGRKRNGECKGTTGRRGRCNVVSGYMVERVQRQHGDERVWARVVRGIGRKARFRGYSVVHPYNGYLLQWLKKLSQYLAILERLTWDKSNQLCNNVKIISDLV